MMDVLVNQLLHAVRSFNEKRKAFASEGNDVKREIMVSVIIPFFNPSEEDYKRCLDSLMRQTLSDIEVLLIDDASDMEISQNVRAYADRDPRFCVYTNPTNIGQGPSRNVGIKHASGEYISFVDIDDYASPDFLEILFNKAKEKDYDIVKGTVSYIRSDGTEFEKTYKLNERIRKGLKNSDPYYVLFTYEFQAGIYSRNLLERESICFQPYRKSQDVLFLLHVCSKAESMALAEDAVYFYCENRQSVIHRVNTKQLEAQIESIRAMLEYLTASVAEDDPNIIRFAKNRLDYGLWMQAYRARDESCREAAKWMLCELRSMLLQLPCCDRICDNDIIYKVLADYGVNLSTKPFSLPWHNPDTDGYIDVLSRWSGFILEHPELENVLLNKYMTIIKTTYDMLSCDLDA